MTFCIESLIEKVKDRAINLQALEKLHQIIYTIICSRKHEIRYRVSRAAAAILELDPEKIESMLYTMENWFD